MYKFFGVNCIVSSDDFLLYNQHIKKIKNSKMGLFLRDLFLNYF